MPSSDLLILSATLPLEAVGDYRPIVLVNGTLKIISKILANRLAPKLQILIKDYQLGFIARRNTLERFATAYEVMHHCKKIKCNAYMLKLDFEKAYDCELELPVISP